MQQQNLIIQSPTYYQPCTIDLPGGYRVSGQSKDQLSDALTVLKEHGIQFLSPPAPAYLRSEPPPMPLVPEAVSVPIPNASEKSFRYYKDIFLDKQNRSSINDESFASDFFILNLAEDVLQNKAPALLEPEDINVFLNALNHLPLLATEKLGEGMTYRTLIEKSKREEMETIAKATQGKHISNFRSFIHWMMKSGFLKDDPTRMINIDDYQPSEKAKISFSYDDLNIIFDPKFEKKMRSPDRHWVPLICLLSGMRLNECCQLYVDDVLLVNGIWCFYVSRDRAGQSVKTESSIRYIPIHSLLIKLGLLDYVEEVRRHGFAHLFPGLSWGENGPAGNVSISLNKTHLRKRCKITDKKKTIGCMRHTFSTEASKSGLLPRVITRLLGHAEDVTVLNKHYVDPAEVPECKRWIEQIQFPPIPALPYAPGRFDKYLLRVKAKEERGERTKVSDGKHQRHAKKAKKEEEKALNAIHQ